MSRKNQVYVVQEAVDLGDHIVSVHWSETIANQTAAALNEKNRMRYGKYAHAEKYWVSQHDVEA